MHLIHSNTIIRPSIGKMIVEAPYVAQHRKAGQFIILRIDESGERIPLTIADTDPENGTITLYYQIMGTTTTRLSQLKDNDSILDIAGPLGHPTEIQQYGHAVCVGGGIGTAPLLPIVRALKEAGNTVSVIVGARSENILILENEMREACDNYYLYTDDGSVGTKGLVTDKLAELLETSKVDVVFAIGPMPMMRAVSNMTKPAEVKTIVSLNTIMVDGTGMCGGCRVTVGGKTKFTCVDGPEFDGHQVNFEELMMKLGTYRAEEKLSLDAHTHKCRLDGAVDHDN